MFWVAAIETVVLPFLVGPEFFGVAYFLCKGNLLFHWSDLHVFLTHIIFSLVKYNAYIDALTHPYSHIFCVKYVSLVMVQKKNH